MEKKKTTKRKAVDNDFRMDRDLVRTARKFSKAEVRALVDSYYQMQKNRCRAANQTTALSKSGDETEIVKWLAEKSEALEGQVKRALRAFCAEHPIAEWLLSVVGIGEVIAAGLIAHIDITQAPTAGHIWAFAGLDPTRSWEKGKKRPHNAALKRLCWIIGVSFMKNSNREGCVYGEIYKKRKALEVERNDAGKFADQAAAALAKKKYGKDTEAYKCYSQGKLPPAHIQRRAERYAVKLFLSHLHEQMYRDYFKTDPPKPYPIAILGHAHKVTAA